MSLLQHADIEQHAQAGWTMDARNPNGFMRVVSVMLTLALFSGQGCFRSYVIPTAELQKLDGFDAEARPPETKKVPTRAPAVAVSRPFRLLQSIDGVSLSFDASSHLWLQTGTQVFGGQFLRLQVTPTLLDGVLLDQAQPLHLELSAVQYARLVGIDPGATILAVLGGTAAGLVVFLLVSSAGRGCGIIVCA